MSFEIKIHFDDIPNKFEIIKIVSQYSGLGVEISKTDNALLLSETESVDEDTFLIQFSDFEETQVAIIIDKSKRLLSLRSFYASEQTIFYATYFALVSYDGRPQKKLRKAIENKYKFPVARQTLSNRYESLEERYEYEAKHWKKGVLINITIFSICIWLLYKLVVNLFI